MKKLLILAVLMPATFALAEYQFDVDYESMGNIDCWNPDNCVHVDAVAYAHNPANPAETYMTSQVVMDGPGGFPLALQYVITADEGAEVFPNASVIDSVVVSYEGPGFEYSWNRDMTGETPGDWVFYLWGPAQPPAEADIMGAGNGCVEMDLGLEWTYEFYPEGVVDVTDDFTVAADETLIIEAGIVVNVLEGVTITVDGVVAADGNADAWIDFSGTAWAGLNFGGTAEAEFNFVRFFGVMDEGNGGALYLADGADVDLIHCIIAGNETGGMGGAAYVEDNAVLYMWGCTVTNNVATEGAGNVHLGGANAVLAGFFNVISYATPANSSVLGDGILNFQYSLVYPQNENFPGDWELNSYYEMPGYADPENFDFTPSFWNVEELEAGNYVKSRLIDVAISADFDPDGTAKDMGAMPFDQHNILQPAVIVEVLDVPADQGGMVLVEFEASLNDGNELNPVSGYSLWIAYPGMEEGEWIAAGTVLAVGEQMTYTAQLNTQDDQYEGMDNIHTFMVGTHSDNFNTPAIASNIAEGFSLDNIAPALVSGLAEGEWSYDQWPPTEDQLPVSWDASNANDLATYRLFAGLSENFEDAAVVYEGMDTDYIWTSPFGDLGEGDAVYFWVEAMDVHMNSSELNDVTVIYTSVDDRIPTSFELAQNYPNPFNPTTTISYALAEAGQVQLTVFNLMGETVVTLVDGEQSAGHYDATFNAANLASGVYFYRLDTASFTDLKKMVLVK
jgi:hypothetical protein